MRQIAIYGKGGIGKSTITSNLAVALAEHGNQVLQVGCDPKRDSTRMLMGGVFVPTVLETLRQLGEGNVKRETILHTGYGGVRCVEAGGPEPGVGCAGRGIIATFELLDELNVYAPDLDFVLYDVLGDVVCGGFAVPIREGYAQEIYLVTSGELMSLYAANNIAQGIARFAQRGGGRLAGVIGNSRGYEGEAALIAEFATRLNTRLVQFIPRDPLVQRAEINRQTVMQYAPDSTLASVYRELAENVAGNADLSQPTPLGMEELEQLVFAHALVSEG